MSDVARCPHCPAEFRADKSQEAAYHASLGQGDKAETERLLVLLNSYWALTFHMKAAHADQMFACGRQRESIAYRPDEPAAYWTNDGSCSYCGSLSPAQFFAAVEAGAEVGPTDKGYKVYLTGPMVPQVAGAQKFYFQHFSQADKDRFIALFNAGQMKIGYPGHFYVLPYFCRPAEPPAGRPVPPHGSGP